MSEARSAPDKALAQSGPDGVVIEPDNDLVTVTGTGAVSFPRGLSGSYLYPSQPMRAGRTLFRRGGSSDHRARTAYGYQRDSD
jgi:hypothetical protein